MAPTPTPLVRNPSRDELAHVLSLTNQAGLSLVPTDDGEGWELVCWIRNNIDGSRRVFDAVVVEEEIEPLFPRNLRMLFGRPAKSTQSRTEPQRRLRGRTPSSPALIRTGRNEERIP